MDIQIVQNIVLVLIGIAGWFMRKTIGDLETKQRLHDEEIKNIQKNYLHRDDFREFKVELTGMFNEIKSDIRALREHKA